MNPSLKDFVAAESAGVRAMDEDRRFVLYNIGWDQYVAMRDLLEHVAGLHMTYLEGTLELMSPSRKHEFIKTLVARLVEIYAVERNVDLSGYGSMTFRKKAEKRGVEPDECYCIGPLKEDHPDVAFEVELSRGAVDKLDVYAGLGVPELWFWRQGKIAVYRLGARGYETRKRSEFLPDLDLGRVAKHAALENQTQAVKAFRDELRTQV